MLQTVQLQRAGSGARERLSGAQRNKAKKDEGMEFSPLATQFMKYCPGIWVFALLSFIIK